MDNIIEIASGVGVAIGLAIVATRQKKQAAVAGPQIVAALREAGSLTLPELVVRLGLKDGFLSRGKVMNLVNPMVANGELVQSEPPGTTMKNRLEVLTFRLGNGATPQ